MPHPEKAKTRPASQLAGRVRTEIADCVTDKPVIAGGKSVQLFYRGAFDRSGRRGLFDFRFLFTEPDQ